MDPLGLASAIAFGMGLMSGCSTHDEMQGLRDEMEGIRRVFKTKHLCIWADAEDYEEQYQQAIDDGYVETDREKILISSDGEFYYKEIVKLRKDPD